MHHLYVQRLILSAHTESTFQINAAHRGRYTFTAVTGHSDACYATFIRVHVGFVCDHAVAILCACAHHTSQFRCMDIYGDPSGHLGRTGYIHMHFFNHICFGTFVKGPNNLLGSGGTSYTPTTRRVIRFGLMPHGVVIDSNDMHTAHLVSYHGHMHVSTVETPFVVPSLSLCVGPLLWMGFTTAGPGDVSHARVLRFLGSSSLIAVFTHLATSTWATLVMVWTSSILGTTAFFFESMRPLLVACFSAEPSSPISYFLSTDGTWHLGVLSGSGTCPRLTCSALHIGVVTVTTSRFVYRLLG